MTPEERLAQVEALLETAARYINRHSESISQNSEAINRIEGQMTQMIALFSELATISRQQQARMEQQQAEIRRIWEYLLSQSGNGRSST